ncbi:N-acetyltransferase [Hyphomonas sp. WL0036]|uniref:GNAT family N-acetyltransferase n=1 Tax=Hyphomonas sediminis TaxID=2866160 RepID=UPI001C82147F|nr:GNAT family N-acetyltransferase [Hyphomonas sediminis]MBY9066271.1 N-acetyltransferase [Hyphomonas sediminis]
MSSEITHDATRQRYSLIVEGVEAYLTYERPSPGIRKITHTIVPDAIGGRGLGKRLVARAIDDIKASGERVLSSCWYASALIDKTPEWASLKA